MASLWVVQSVALGCLIAFRFGDLRKFRPRWISALLIFGAGTAMGIGVGSCIFFLCRLWIASAVVPQLFEVALTAALAFNVYRNRGNVRLPVAAQTHWTPILGTALLGSVLLGTWVMLDSWAANPQGHWDAWEDWNMRARVFSAPGKLAFRAWSPLLHTHVEYPMLQAGFIARSWSYGGETSPAVPVLYSYLLFLAGLALGTATIATLRSPTLGLLFGISLASTPFFLHQVAWQYADIPLAGFITAAVALLMLDRPILAGLCASFAAWTKHEGALFLTVFFVAILLFRRRAFVKAFLSALPVACLFAFFKLVLARGATSLLAESGPGLHQRMVDPMRYWATCVSFLGEFRGMMYDGWYHPLLPVLILAVALGFGRNLFRDVRFPAFIVGAMFAGYMAVLIATPGDLNWYLNLSVHRLFAQIWPSIFITLFMTLRTPEEAIAPEYESQREEQESMVSV